MVLTGVLALGTLGHLSIQTSLEFGPLSAPLGEPIPAWEAESQASFAQQSRTI